MQSTSDELIECCCIVGLWGLVNNAGVCIYAEFDWLTWDQVSKQVSVNLIGTIAMTKAFLPLVKEAKGELLRRNEKVVRPYFQDLRPVSLLESDAPAHQSLHGNSEGYNETKRPASFSFFLLCCTGKIRSHCERRLGQWDLCVSWYFRLLCNQIRN